MVDLDNVLYPALFERLDVAFPEFGWVRTRDGWKATNNDHTKSTFGVRADRTVCNRPYGFYAHGGSYRTWLDYVSGGSHLRGEEFTEAVARLASKAGVDLVFNVSPEQQAQVAATARKRSLHEDFWGLVTDGLEVAELSKRRDYLVSRDLSPVPGDIDCGYVGDFKVLGKKLLELGYSYEELEAFGLHKFCPWNARIVGKVLGHRGQIEGFWFRATEATTEGAKYVYSSGLDWATVGVSGTTKLGSDVCIVEGVFEPEIFRTAGLPLYAIGGSGEKLTADLWKLLTVRGVRRVSLFLDEDAAGVAGRKRALEHYSCLGISERPDLYIVDNNTGFKDPDEIRKNRGVDAVRELIDSAKHYLRFVTKSTLDSIRGDGDWTDKKLDEAFTTLVRESATAPLVEAQRYVLPELESLFPEVSQEDIYKRIEQEKARVAELKKKQEYTAVAHQLAAVAQKEGIDNAIKYGKEAFNNLAVNKSGNQKESVAALADLLSRHKAQLAAYWGRSRFIGLQQKTIPALDEAFMGLRGVVVLPGPPNAGKSGLAHQIGMDIVKHNDNACYVYLALEMDAADHINRMWSRFADLDYRTFRTGSHHGDGPTKAFTREEITRINAAEIEMTMYGTRMLILDKHNCPDVTAEGVKKIVEDFKRTCGAERVYLLVDYLQRWPIPPEKKKELGSDLACDDWRIEQIEQLVTSKDDPVVVISQQPKADAGGSFGALSKVKGSVTTAYTAEAVMFIRNITDKELCELRWKHDVDAATETQLPTNVNEAEKKLRPVKEYLAKEGMQYCMVTVAKGRDGMERCDIPVTFYFRKSSFAPGWEVPMTWG